MGISVRTIIRHLSLALLIFAPITLSAQRKVVADVEVKQVAKGKVTTITKSVYCANNGRLVVHFHKPEDYYVVTNLKGETRLYMPKTNEVYSDNSDAMSSKDELMLLFMNGRVDDLGLGMYGYKLQSTVNEEGHIKKTYVSDSKANAPKVEIVFENFLPIYMAYLDGAGRITSKSYFTKYETSGRFHFPTRHTTITYVAKDSTVTRTVYSNIRVDQEDPGFNFEIPSNAKSVTLKSK